MTSSTPVSSVVLSRYASALIDLAEKAKSVEKIQKDFNSLESAISDSQELAEVISSPLVSSAKQAAIILEIADKAKLQDLTRNFLNVLIQNRRLYALSAIMKAYKKEVSKRSGELSVRVETAEKMTAAQKKEFETKISGVLGSGVAIEAVVSPEIIGGMVVTIGSFMVDDSVRRKLERLSSALKNSSNQNTVNLKEVV